MKQSTYDSLVADTDQLWFYMMRDVGQAVGERIVVLVGGTTEHTLTIAEIVRFPSIGDIAGYAVVNPYSVFDGEVVVVRLIL